MTGFSWKKIRRFLNSEDRDELATKAAESIITFDRVAREEIERAEKADPVEAAEIIYIGRRSVPSDVRRRLRQASLLTKEAIDTARAAPGYTPSQDKAVDGVLLALRRWDTTFETTRSEALAAARTFFEQKAEDRAKLLTKRAERLIRLGANEKLGMKSVRDALYQNIARDSTATQGIDPAALAHAKQGAIRSLAKDFDYKDGEIDQIAEVSIAFLQRPLLSGIAGKADEALAEIATQTGQAARDVIEASALAARKKEVFESIQGLDTPTAAPIWPFLTLSRQRAVEPDKLVAARKAALEAVETDDDRAMIERAFADTTTRIATLLHERASTLRLTIPHGKRLPHLAEVDHIAEKTALAVAKDAAVGCDREIAEKLTGKPMSDDGTRVHNLLSGGVFPAWARHGWVEPSERWRDFRRKLARRPLHGNLIGSQWQQEVIRKNLALGAAIRCIDARGDTVLVPDAGIELVYGEDLIDEPSHDSFGATSEAAPEEHGPFLYIDWARARSGFLANDRHEPKFHKLVHDGSPGNGDTNVMKLKTVLNELAGTAESIGNAFFTKEEARPVLHWLQTHGSIDIALDPDDGLMAIVLASPVKGPDGRESIAADHTRADNVATIMAHFIRRALGDMVAAGSPYRPKKDNAVKGEPPYGAPIDGAIRIAKSIRRVPCLLVAAVGSDRPKAEEREPLDPATDSTAVVYAIAPDEVLPIAVARPDIEDGKLVSITVPRFDPKDGKSPPVAATRPDLRDAKVVSVAVALPDLKHDGALPVAIARSGPKEGKVLSVAVARPVLGDDRTPPIAVARPDIEDGKTLSVAILHHLKTSPTTEDGTAEDKAAIPERKPLQVRTTRDGAVTPVAAAVALAERGIVRRNTLTSAIESLKQFELNDDKASTRQLAAHAALFSTIPLLMGLFFGAVFAETVLDFFLFGSEALWVRFLLLFLSLCLGLVGICLCYIQYWRLRFDQQDSDSDRESSHDASWNGVGGLLIGLSLAGAPLDAIYKNTEPYLTITLFEAGLLGWILALISVHIFFAYMTFDQDLQETLTSSLFGSEHEAAQIGQASATDRLKEKNRYLFKYVTIFAPAIAIFFILLFKIGPLSSVSDIAKDRFGDVARYREIFTSLGWAMPILGFGVLVSAWTRFGKTGLTTLGHRNAQRRLKQAESLIREYEPLSALLKERNKSLHFADLEKAANAIAPAADLVKAHQERTEARFVRSTALVAAAVVALLQIDAFEKLEPKKEEQPQTPLPTVDTWLRDSFIKALGNLPNPRPDGSGAPGPPGAASVQGSESHPCEGFGSARLLERHHIACLDKGRPLHAKIGGILDDLSMSGALGDALAHVEREDCPPCSDKARTIHAGLRALFEGQPPPKPPVPPNPDAIAEAVQKQLADDFETATVSRDHLAKTLIQLILTIPEGATPAPPPDPVDPDAVAGAVQKQLAADFETATASRKDLARTLIHLILTTPEGPPPAQVDPDAVADAVQKQLADDFATAAASRATLLKTLVPLILTIPEGAAPEEIADAVEKVLADDFEAAEASRATLLATLVARIGEIPEGATPGEIADAVQKTLADDFDNHGLDRNELALALAGGASDEDTPEFALVQLLRARGRVSVGRIPERCGGPDGKAHGGELVLARMNWKTNAHRYGDIERECIADAGVLDAICQSPPTRPVSENRLRTRLQDILTNRTKDAPKRYSHLLVVGFADTKGLPHINRELSRNRAVAIRNALGIGQFDFGGGVLPIAVNGLGEDPSASVPTGTSYSKLASARRAEIRLCLR